MPNICLETVSFRHRSYRSNYIAKRFGGYLTGGVLDVGCDKALLKALMPGIKYTGIDIGGTPDLTVDLEKVERLPFDDDTFDALVCSDVLEHLENLHFMFGELVRVTRRYLVISLPNNWTHARKPIRRGRGAVTHYGLPLERPIDRHKWFFNCTDALEFLRGQCSGRNLSLREAVANENPRPLLVRAFRRARYPKLDSYLNRYAHTVWAVLEKNGPE